MSKINLYNENKEVIKTVEFEDEYTDSFDMTFKKGAFEFNHATIEQEYDEDFNQKFYVVWGNDEGKAIRAEYISQEQAQEIYSKEDEDLHERYIQARRNEIIIAHHKEENNENNEEENEEENNEEDKEENENVQTIKLYDDCKVVKTIKLNELKTCNRFEKEAFELTFKDSDNEFKHANIFYENDKGKYNDMPYAVWGNRSSKAIFAEYLTYEEAEKLRNKHDEVEHSVYLAEQIQKKLHYVI